LAPSRWVQAKSMLQESVPHLVSALDRLTDNFLAMLLCVVVWWPAICIKFCICLHQLNFHCFYAFVLHWTDGGEVQVRFQRVACIILWALQDQKNFYTRISGREWAWCSTIPFGQKAYFRAAPWMKIGFLIY